ncbi:MAG: HlyC/CorC family transporter [Filimonas sp.]|nr:HlyC/CorC family transporter [Filimonas sp.]
MTEIYLLVLIACTLVLMGFFAGTEIAFNSANRLNIELKKKQGKSKGIILSRFMDNPSEFIGTSLVGMNIFLIVYALLCTELLHISFWGKGYFGLDMSSLGSMIARVLVDTLIFSLIALIFGEFIPKAVFRAKSDTLLSSFALIYNFCYKIFRPVVKFFVSISEWTLKNLFNVRVRESGEAFSRIDLDHVFQQTKESDEDNQELNTELFANAMSLPLVKVRQCLVPRTEIEAIESTATIEDIRRRFLETKLSKLVVFGDNIDNILGYVHQLDLFKKPKDISSILLPIPAVPESMSATDLITKFSKERKSIAWVVDEFGGTAGIVTMEDVLEEIFGEIKDEYDIEEFVEKQLAENEYIFSGRLELDYLNEKYHFEFPEHESETLSGYIIHEYETIPKLKERIIIGRYEFDILNVSDTRIETVKMKVLR